MGADQKPRALDTDAAKSHWHLSNPERGQRQGIEQPGLDDQWLAHYAMESDQQYESGLDLHCYQQWILPDQQFQERQRRGGAGRFDRQRREDYPMVVWLIGQRSM